MNTQRMEGAVLVMLLAICALAAMLVVSSFCVRHLNLLHGAQKLRVDAWEQKDHVDAGMLETDISEADLEANALSVV